MEKDRHPGHRSDFHRCKSVEGRNVISDWFTIDHIDKITHIISKDKHWEETHAYLLNGKNGCK